MISAEEDESELCIETTWDKMCRKLPKKTSPGPDGIAYEVFIYGNTHLIQSTCRMFNIIWRAEEVLGQWKRSNIKTIYKVLTSYWNLANWNSVSWILAKWKDTVPGDIRQLSPISATTVAGNGGYSFGNGPTKHRIGRIDPILYTIFHFFLSFSLFLFFLSPSNPVKSGN